MELLKKENLIGLMEEVGQLYGERGTLNIPYNLRRLASKYQGNFKYATKRLKNFKTNISGILDGLKNPETPSAFSAPIYLTRVCIYIFLFTLGKSFGGGLGFQKCWQMLNIF